MTKQYKEDVLLSATAEKIKFDPDRATPSAGGNGEPPGRSNSRNPIKWLLRALRVVLQQPYLGANTVLTILAGTCVLVMLGLAGFGAHFARLVSGDEMAMVQSTTAIIAFLCGTMGLTLISMATRQAKQDEEDTDAKANNANLAEEVRQELTELRSLHVEMFDTVSVLALQSQDTWHRRKSDVHAWASFAPGTSLTSCFGNCATEIRARLNAAGEVTYFANLGLLEQAWSPRFRDFTSLSQATHILDGNVEPNSQRPSGVLRTVAAYRALQGIALDKGFNINLRKVRIVISNPDKWPVGSVFIGVKKAHGSEVQRHPFVQRYASIPLLAAAHLNSQVEVSYSTEIHAHFSAIANELVQNAECTMNLEEAEARFGHLVPELANADNSPIKFPTMKEEHFDGDWLI